jgi:hypothetical protein
MRTTKTPDNPNKPLWSFEQAGRFLGVRAETLKAAAARGAIAVVQLNKQQKIPRCEVARLSGGALK